MSQVIVFENADGGVSLIPQIEELTMQELGQRFVPAGTPYWIVDRSTIPTDRTFRDAWALAPDAMDNPDGYGGQVPVVEEEEIA